MDVTRRGIFGFFAGLSSGLAARTAEARTNAPSEGPTPLSLSDFADLALPGDLTHALLRKRLGKEIYRAWFMSVEFEVLQSPSAAVFSVPVKFCRNWINEYYKDDLFECARQEFPAIRKVMIVYRPPEKTFDTATRLPS